MSTSKLCMSIDVLLLLLLLLLLFFFFFFFGEFLPVKSDKLAETLSNIHTAPMSCVALPLGRCCMQN
jgi:hypothetical protein